MHRRRIRLTLFIILFFLGELLICEAKTNIKLGNTATWTVTIDTVTAGTDVTDSYYTTDTQYYFSMINPKNNYRIDMERTTGSWNANLSICVMRTTDGSGSGTISGGTSYIEITDSVATFFTGSDARNDVYIKYRIDGVTVPDLAATTYTSTITYTGVDN
ncbi:MAG: hypothetical protein JW881_10540 [Spirochaetales bacterium]|nr:hypothetical protein [Spirochaetales bacterium]